MFFYLFWPKLAYDIFRETVTAIMTLTIVMEHILDGIIDFFNIVAEVLRGDTLVVDLSVICIKSADYTDYVKSLSNTPAQVECLLHSLASSWTQITQSSKWSHFHIKLQLFEISRLFYIPQ